MGIQCLAQTQTGICILCLLLNLLGHGLAIWLMVFSWNLLGDGFGTGGVESPGQNVAQGLVQLAAWPVKLWQHLHQYRTIEGRIKPPKVAPQAVALGVGAESNDLIEHTIAKVQIVGLEQLLERVKMEPVLLMAGSKGANLLLVYDGKSST